MTIEKYKEFGRGLGRGYVARAALPAVVEMQEGKS